ncbi:polyprenyl synthetase family protein [Heliorestis acidaminivorans]|uniref:Farnesyl diphosphate synthase n=1 Tax=Heliorestis acidaminivorans TaxID=553427 RepID=A0A6I0ESD2_9FIRM|nr:farnesyl diphosphate synthase [Heliorestis acidaminivorans]KAB2951721.1 polyprenyl synthetase family protein [Heliorestis acidaminivorans]
MALQIDSALETSLPEEKAIPPVIHQSMRYSLFAGGKRLRPVLALAACRAVQGDDSKVMAAACALEMIHTYSLIHDDLPAMDDDDLRRGKPTNHIVYGEAMAILAGDGLLTRAFGLLAESAFAEVADQQETSLAQRYLQVMAEIAHASGSQGMIGGQVMDIEAEEQKIDLSTMEYIHQHKTGALIKTSLRAGAILGGGSEEEITALTSYGEYLGLAFQITDDLLDVQGDTAKLGKPVGSDEKNQKSTYPSLLGLEKAREAAETAVQSAVEALDNFGPEAELLRQLALYLLEREN